MRLYTFEIGGRLRVGAEAEGKLVDLQAVDPTLPDDLRELVRLGKPGLERAQQAIEHALARKDDPALWFERAAVRLRAPLRPGKVLCSGINYHGHFRENPKAKMPDEPFFFAKLPSSVSGPGDPIVLPPMSKQVDYEVELGVVIGRRLARAQESDVMDSIFGYTILHDVSARDVQFKDSQITIGKNFDGFAPIGPCVVTRDELPRPDRLKLRTLLNGEVMQDGSNEDWVFTLPRLLSFLSQVMALEPGDLVSTGTPAGVGYFRQPQVFLKPGDRVALEIDVIGRLENPVASS
jgi:2-keto-4-pentenoate hydratase/2-oxohepta-3-ene-1,7-dioic acid hydratase in catechol pathway